MMANGSFPQKLEETDFVRAISNKGIPVLSTSTDRSLQEKNLDMYWTLYMLVNRF